MSTPDTTSVNSYRPARIPLLGTKIGKKGLTPREIIDEASKTGGTNKADIEDLCSHIDGLEADVARLKREVVGVDARVDAVDKALSGAESDLQSVSELVDATLAKTDGFEEKLNALSGKVSIMHDAMCEKTVIGLLLRALCAKTGVAFPGCNDCFGCKK